MPERLFDVKVGGDFACFTRPEFKAERVSYPIITPGAARGLLEAIFWTPAFRWEIREVRVLHPLRQTTVRRNELGSRQVDRPVFIEDERQQRASLILADVAYVLRAAMVLRPDALNPLPKYAAQFDRRLNRGQCHHTPYLGTREFGAWFEPASGEEPPVALDLDVGPMLFDIAYREGGTRSLEFYDHGASGRRLVRGDARALFFPASVRAGVLRVPPDLYRRLDEEGDADA